MVSKAVQINTVLDFVAVWVMTSCRLKDISLIFEARG
jgi:hypothetical protein